VLRVEAVLQIRQDQIRLAHGSIAHQDALDRGLRGAADSCKGSDSSGLIKAFNGVPDSTGSSRGYS